MTEHLFRANAYLKEAEATVIEILDLDIILDATVFYPRGGGQPGDTGEILRKNGQNITIVDTLYTTDRKQIIHRVSSPDHGLRIGEPVSACLDWEKRFKRMKIHTALHLLSCVLPYPVTGGAIGDGDGRLDFDIPDAVIDKAVVNDALNVLISQNAEVSDSWISDAELDAQPELIKTLSVQPPRGSGQIRLVKIAGIDLQPCGGTHVSNTRDIGAVEITDIEKKGKQNRRVRLRLV